MIRALGLLAVVAMALFVPGRAAAEIMLRPSVVVAGDVIRLGDLFRGAGDHAAEVVAPAPAPGTRVTYNADWLAAMAREHHLSWSPPSRYDRATVERASRTIGADAVAARLLAEVTARRPVEDAEIRLDNPGLRFVVPAEAGDAIAVDGLRLDQRTGRLSAFVSAPAGDPRAERQRVTARLVYLLDVPVPNHPLAPGDIIAASDLDHIKLRRDRVAPDVATDAAELVGKTPRRSIRARQPVRAADVQAPVVVRKNELVTILLETPLMRLTTQGKALDDGAMGAVIRVSNTKSNRVIDAVVTAPNTVRVGNPAQLAAAR